MSYGDGRRDGRAGARRARLRVREEIRPADRARSSTSAAGRIRPTRWEAWYADMAAACNSGAYDGLDYPAAFDAIAADLEPRGLGAQAGRSGACATGASRASATGAARFRSSIAPAAATCRCRTTSCRCVLPEDCVPDGRGNPLDQGRTHVARPLPEVRRPARAARRTPWTPSWSRPGISCATPRRATTRRWSMRARSTGCRSTSTSAASSTRSCTCCIRASGRASCATAGWWTVDEPFAATC